MVKGEVDIIKDLKIIIFDGQFTFHIFKFECLFCNNFKQTELVDDHFIFLRKEKEYHCRKRNKN